MENIIFKMSVMRYPCFLNDYVIYRDRFLFQATKTKKWIEFKENTRNILFTINRILFDLSNDENKDCGREESLGKQGGVVISDCIIPRKGDFLVRDLEKGWAREETEKLFRFMSQVGQNECTQMLDVSDLDQCKRIAQKLMFRIRILEPYLRYGNGKTKIMESISP